MIRIENKYVHADTRILLLLINDILLKDDFYIF